MTKEISMYYSKHLSSEEYIKAVCNPNSRKKIKTKYRYLYNKIIENWETPSKWYKSDNKRLRIYKTNPSDTYWFAWGIIKNKKIPYEFIKSSKLMKSENVLKNILKDFTKLKESIEALKSVYSKQFISKVYPNVMKLCAFCGVDTLEKVSIEDIEEANGCKLFLSGTGPYMMMNVLYFMGYRQKPPGRDYCDGIESRKAKVNSKWSRRMSLIIQDFIDNMKSSSLTSYEMPLEKLRGINRFADWYSKSVNTTYLDDLINFNRTDWLKYVEYVINLNDKSNKTKGTILLAIVQFFQWLQVKHPEVINGYTIINQSDYKILSNHNNNYNLAFEKREYGEKILRYLIDDFKTNEVKKMFYKEAVIIAANTGMRISEISRIKLGCCFWSEDEGCYKIILDYVDKLNRKNRPVYLTKDGYEAIKRLEELRNNSGLINDRMNIRSNKSYKHLFEYRGKNPLESSKLYDFLSDIKSELELFDEYGGIIKGGFHAFRHMFAMTVFEESDYNIGVVRYLLGHCHYDMSFKYLEEEKEKRIAVLREQKEKDIEKYSGKGLDTILEVILNSKKSKEYIALRKALEQSEKLSNLIDNKIIKKVGFGYCLNPCENANRCIRCNKFIITAKEKDNLLKVADEMFKFLSFKMTLFESPEVALSKGIIREDISDLCVLLEEMRNLGIDMENYFDKLKGCI